MKRGPGNSAWYPLLGVIVQMAALGLCSWAMASARNRGRELSGGTSPAAPPTPPGAPPSPPFQTAQPAWSPGVPPPPTGTVPPPPAS